MTVGHETFSDESAHAMDTNSAKMLELLYDSSIGWRQFLIIHQALQQILRFTGEYF